MDFVVPRRPVSHQAKNKDNLERWREFVYGRAFQAWRGVPVSGLALRFTMVYLAEEAEDGDINNFVKPVQDALNTLVYADDSLIMDVSAHKRVLSDPVDIKGMPRKLAMAIIHGVPCVYVSISRSRQLREEIQ